MNGELVEPGQAPLKRPARPHRYAYRQRATRLERRLAAAGRERRAAAQDAVIRVRPLLLVREHLRVVHRDRLEAILPDEIASRGIATEAFGHLLSRTGQPLEIEDRRGGMTRAANQRDA